MMPLDSIRKRNAVKFVVQQNQFSEELHYVKREDDKHLYDHICLCYSRETADVIASLLTDYAASCAAQNVELFPTIKTETFDDKRWPVDKGYEAWQSMQKEMDHE